MSVQPADKPALAVWPVQASLFAQAEQLAAQLGLTCLPADAEPPARAYYPFLLSLAADGLALVQGKSRIAVDFTAGASQHRRLHGGGRGQPIAKAVGLKSGNITPRVLDCTAGLARDAFVLASLGCQVELIERSPLVHALLQDGLLRAQGATDPAVREIVARMSLLSGDAAALMAAYPSSERPDVVYLDPMFPERRKQAAVKKDMAAFHTLLGGDEDADRLLLPALALARCRVVVKRPRHAPFLAGEKPSISLQGESTRFDIYPLRSMATAISGTGVEEG